MKRGVTVTDITAADPGKRCVIAALANINLSFGPHAMHLHGFYFMVEATGDLGVERRLVSGQQRTVVTERIEPARTFVMSWTPERAGNWLFHCHMTVGHNSCGWKYAAAVGSGCCRRRSSFASHGFWQEKNFYALIVSAFFDPLMAEDLAPGLARQDLLYRQVSRLGAFQYLVHVYSSRNSILGRSVFVQLTSSKKKISVVTGVTTGTSASFSATTV
jgi:Multicopper oxidase